MTDHRTAVEIANDWYKVDEIEVAIKRELTLGLSRDVINPMPTDVSTREFAVWLTDQYRLAMVKGVQLSGVNEALARIAELEAEVARLSKELKKTEYILMGVCAGGVPEYIQENAKMREDIIATQAMVLELQKRCGELEAANAQLTKLSDSTLTALERKLAE